MNGYLSYLLACLLHLYNLEFSLLQFHAAGLVMYYLLFMHLLINYVLGVIILLIYFILLLYCVQYYINYVSVTINDITDMLWYVLILFYITVSVIYFIYLFIAVCICYHLIVW